MGISVDSATDVAKDAADVILLDKDLDVLADGVTEGRRIFELARVGNLPGVPVPPQPSHHRQTHLAPIPVGFQNYV